MIYWTEADKQMLEHAAEVMGDRIHGEPDGYTDQDRATVAKLEELSKLGSAVTVCGNERARSEETNLFQSIVTAEMASWEPNASQRLLYRAGMALNFCQPDPAAGKPDCGDHPGDHALSPGWLVGIYVHRCATCFRVYRA